MGQEAEVSQPLREVPDRVYLSRMCSGYSETRESVHDAEYIRVSSITEKAQRAAKSVRQLLDPWQIDLGAAERRVADIIAADFQK